MNTKRNKRVLIPFLISLIGSVVMLSMILFPYASSKDEYRELLIEYGNERYTYESSITNGEVVDISLIEYARLYAECSNNEQYQAQCVVGIVLISAFALLATLTIIFAACKKPIGVIIADVLSIGVFGLNQFDFADRRVLPSSTYDWGIASNLTYILGALVLAGAIWLIVEKNLMKKQKQTTEE